MILFVPDPGSTTASTSLIASTKLPWLPILDDGWSTTPEDKDAFDMTIDGEHLLEDTGLGVIDEETVVCGIIVRDEAEVKGISSLELLLEETHEYDFKAAECIKCDAPELTVDNESCDESS